MKIKLKTVMAGPNGVFNPGDELDLPVEQAQALIQGCYALAVLEIAGTVIESGMIVPEEKAVLSMAKAKKRKME